MPEPCSLYLLAIAEPGAGKTTINRLVMNPCYEFADRLIQQYEERNKDYKTELQIWNTRQKALAANLRKVVNQGYPGNRKKRRCVITKEINRHVRFDRILSMKMFRLKRLWKGSMNILRQGYFWWGGHFFQKLSEKLSACWIKHGVGNRLILDGLTRIPYRATSDIFVNVSAGCLYELYK